MLAFAIVIRDNEISEQGFKALQESSAKVQNAFAISRFDAITPEYAEKTLASYNIKWNYPWEGQQVDFASGLTKSAYPTKNPDARIACALSHYSLWKRCLKLRDPILILEHDATFVNRINFDPKSLRSHIVGINSPLGATRKAQVFHEMVQKHPSFEQPVPWIDDRGIPQGLAGNSAYIIKPEGAERLIKLVKEFGLWPNDAIMCKQLVPKMAVTKQYYTQVQGLRSTTSL